MGKKASPEENDKYAHNTLTCPECGSRRVESTEKQHKFLYGTEADKVELSAKVPVRKCEDCGFSFFDHVFEEICHNVVCRHLGVMTPTQIKDLRNLYNLTQAQFSEFTKLGEATLSRWERGAIIQNQAYDNYLYLLGFKENHKRIYNKSTTIEQWPFDTSRNTSETTNVKLRDVPEGSPRFQTA